MMNPLIEGVPLRLDAWISAGVTHRQRWQSTPLFLQDKIFDSDADAVIFMQSTFHPDVGAYICSRQRLVIAIPPGKM
jgi:hypothetical protein